MIFRLYSKSETEHKELQNITKIELKRHFKSLDYKQMIKKDHVYIDIDNKAFFNDLEDAKIKLYSDNDYDCLTDFISDVQENLSFVPKIEVS